MGFHEQAVFPSKIAQGSTFGPSFNTAISEVRGGAETRVGYYEVPRHMGDVSGGISTWAEMMALKKFYVARLGAMYGFRFPDPLDNTSNDDGVSAPTSVDQLIGEGDGTTVHFQLRKQYIDGGVTRNRTIQKPIAGTVSVSIGNVTQSSGWSVDTTTGTITFTSAPANGAQIKAGFRFHVPVRFGDDADKGLLVSFAEWQLGNVGPIEIIELIDERPTDDEVFRGGSALITMTADVSVSPATGLLLRCVPDQSGRKLYLPSTQNLEGGGPYFYIQNNQPTYTLDIVNNNGTLVVQAAATKVYQLLIFRDSAGVKTWFAVGPF